MVKTTRTLKQVNQELAYLEHAYQRLKIKTIPYRKKREELEAEKNAILKMNDKELAQIERNAKKQKKASFEDELRQLNAGKDKEEFIDRTGDSSENVSLKTQ